MEYGANPNIQDIWGRTALHFAAKDGHKNIINLLLVFGVDVNIWDRNDFNTSYWA